MLDNTEFAFSDQEFERVKLLIGERTGIHITEDKKALVYARITRRLRALKLKNFADYFHILQSDSKDETQRFINAVTTNLTSFFREQHHFDFLREEFVPKVMEQNSKRKTINIWSAGCSSGEEVYSIAIALSEAIPNIAQWNVRIVGTDIDSDMLATGRNGVYEMSRVEGISESLLKKYFLRGKGRNAGRVKVGEKLAEMVTFDYVNLVEPWNLQCTFDFIFCRNALIYFDAAVQKDIVDRFSNELADQGYLAVGHSENILKLTDKYKLVGKSIYEKDRVVF